MKKAFSYVVARDYGFAPNPFYGVLTLATCKPIIRNNAQVNDFIIGNATAANDNKLIFMAKVTEVTTFDDYWLDPRFQCKKPVMNGSLKKLYGDNIYHRNSTGAWLQDDSHHANDDGSPNQYNIDRDTGTTDRVLICGEFFYFGKSMFIVPEEFRTCIYGWRGHSCPAYDKALKLWEYLCGSYPNRGKIDLPNQFEHFKRYDGKK